MAWLVGLGLLCCHPLPFFVFRSSLPLADTSAISYCSLSMGGVVDRSWSLLWIVECGVRESRGDLLAGESNYLEGLALFYWN